MQALPERVAADQLLQLGRGRGMPAKRQLGSQAVLQYGQAKLLQPLPLGSGERLVSHLGQRRPPPQPQRLPQHPDGQAERVPAMCFLDLVGYTRLTEQRGDAATAELAGTLAVLADRSAREHGGVPVKWLGDGVMVHFREPAGAVLSALRMVQQLPKAGLPPAYVGVAAGPVVAQVGDYCPTDCQPHRYDTGLAIVGGWSPSVAASARRPPRMVLAGGAGVGRTTGGGRPAPPVGPFRAGQRPAGSGG